MTAKGPPNDILGRTFGSWTVLAYAGRNRHNQHRWEAQCACGQRRAIPTSTLRCGYSTSCGCGVKWRVTHGLTRAGHRNGTPEYRAWAGLRSRCVNPVGRDWENYGGRGITVCERWESFTAFLEDVGPRPSPKHTIDRINNDGNYEPGNVRWVTRTVQVRNRRNNVRLTIGGVTLCVGEWAARLGITAPTLRSRLRLGWAPEKALTTPVRVRGRAA